MVEYYEYFYPGTSDSLNPSSDSLYTGVSVPQGTIGASTGIQTANQIKDVANYLNQGMKVVELSTIDPNVFEMIPKQHMKEINRLAQLTGSEVSVHGPTLEPSGFTQQGWSEQNREIAERQMTDTVIRAHELNPKGDMPITFHASVVPGTEFVPISVVGEQNLTPDEKKVWLLQGRIPSTMVAVNQESGEMTGLKREKLYGPREPEGKVFTPEARLEMANNTQWINKITNLAFYKKEADEVLARSQPELQPFLDKIKQGKPLTQEEMAIYTPGMEQLNKANLFLDNVQTSFRPLYEEAAKFGKEDSETKEVLKQISKKWYEYDKEIREKAKQKKLTDVEIVNRQSILLDESLNLLRGINPPKVFVPVEDFIKDKASETFSNVAIAAYKKFGSNAPIVSIENPPYGQAGASAEDLRKVIEESREKFIKKATKEGYSESEAKKAAEQLIGATWDTSHISMMRKQGFIEADLIKEAAKISPFLKHVHLNDNFGHTHTDLPPGMGNVPFKEIMKELGEKGKQVKKVFEGGQFFQHFQTPPHAMVLEAMGSPIYGIVAQPTWTQVYGTQGAYSTGYGLMLPEQHFSMYGSGFSTLPSELGGQASGKQSRLTGTPNA